jgi:hypothetical protein
LWIIVSGRRHQAVAQRSSRDTVQGAVAIRFFRERLFPKQPGRYRSLGPTGFSNSPPANTIRSRASAFTPHFTKRSARYAYYNLNLLS